MHTTSASLLERLRQPGEQQAWGRFVRLYTPLLHRWARRLGLDDHAAADLVQEVFALLLRKLPDFNYDQHKRFRGWLWTVTQNVWRTAQRRKTEKTAAGDSGLPEPAVADPAEVHDEEEYRRYLVGRALKLMQAEFQPATWQAFCESVTADAPAAAVAARLGMSVQAVYAAKSRVLRRLREELAGLLD